MTKTTIDREREATLRADELVRFALSPSTPFSTALRATALALMSEQEDQWQKVRELLAYVERVRPRSSEFDCGASDAYADVAARLRSIIPAESA